MGRDGGDDVTQHVALGTPIDNLDAAYSRVRAHHPNSSAGDCAGRLPCQVAVYGKVRNLKEICQRPGFTERMADGEVLLRLGLPLPA